MQVAVVNDDDADMQAVKYGDSEAMGRLMRRWRGQMCKFYWSMCWRRTNSIEREDFLQEIALRIWARSAGYREGTFRGWIHCIANSVLVSSFRKNKCSTSSFPESFDAEDRRHICVSIDDREIHQRASEYLLNRCGPNMGEVMLYLLSDDITVKECGEQLGMPLATVRWWRANLLSELQNRKESLIHETVPCV